MPERDRRMIGELLRNPNAARIRYVERRFAEAGYAEIRQPHLPILEYIDHDTGSRITDLARHANITVQAMGELVDYLAERGYVERVPDPGDGRARLVRLTDRGREMYRLAGCIVGDLEAIWAGYLGRDRFRQLKHLLADLNDAIAADPGTYPS
jgi:DNA-binding MarR family transcriptional regulator